MPGAGLVDHQLARFRGRVALGEVGLRVVVPVLTQRRGAGGGADRLVVAVDDGEALQADLAVRGLHAGDGGDLGHRGCGQGRHLAGQGAVLDLRRERLLRFDRHVGRGRAGDRGEGDVDGVGEDQRAGDEGDPEQDGEGGQGHPALVGEEVAKACREHGWSISSCARRRRTCASGRARCRRSGRATRPRSGRRRGRRRGPRRRRRPGRG